MADLALDQLELDALPDALLTLSPRDIRQVFPNPTLIRIPGGTGAPLFVSVVLHGNEVTGFIVLQRLARWLRAHRLPRPLMILVGNVLAVEAGKRHLDGQADFNRIWKGGDGPEHALAREVLKQVKAAQPIAAIDIHNNTGTNPHYACVNALDPASLHLASLFSPTLVYFRNPDTVLSLALSEICPATTIEAGKPGDPTGVERAFDFVLDALHLSAFRAAGCEPHVKIFETAARVEIEATARFGFSPSSDAPLLFPAEMDRWNFSEKPAGTRWAACETDRFPLRAVNATGADLTSDFFEMRPDGIYLTRDVTPSMITLDTGIIRDDCFGYLMVRRDTPC